MPCGKKRKRHKIATHKRKKTPSQKPSQEEITNPYGARLLVGFFIGQTAQDKVRLSQSY